MAQYNDAAFDDDLADDWEAAAEAEEEAEAARLAEEAAREEEKKKRALKRKKRQDAEEDDEDGPEEDADYEAAVGQLVQRAEHAKDAGEMMARTEEAEAKPVLAAVPVVSSKEEASRFALDVATKLREHQEKMSYKHLFTNLIKQSCAKLSTDDINELLRKVAIAQQSRDKAITARAAAASGKPASRANRNVDLDAFSLDTDGRGGAFATENDDFM